MLAVPCSGIFLAAIDQTVVVTVLPRIIDDLEGGFNPGAVERAGWIITSYLFGFTVVLPLMGKVADLYGQRRTSYLAMMIFALGLGLATIAVSGNREFGWYSFDLPLLVIGIVVLVAFILSDLRAEPPLVNFQLFVNRSFASANIAHFLVGIALITALVQVPSFAYSSGWPESSYTSPLTGGLLLIRLTLMIPIGAILGGILCGRIGERAPGRPGLCAFRLRVLTHERLGSGCDDTGADWRSRRRQPGLWPGDRPDQPGGSKQRPRKADGLGFRRADHQPDNRHDCRPRGAE
ncbi:MAG: MFS transporter [Thermoleophilia bacterium]